MRLLAKSELPFGSPGEVWHMAWTNREVLYLLCELSDGGVGLAAYFCGYTSCVCCTLGP